MAVVIPAVAVLVDEPGGGERVGADLLLCCLRGLEGGRDDHESRTRGGDGVACSRQRCGLPGTGGAFDHEQTRLAGQRRDDVPEHVRSLTSERVLAVETDLINSIARRAAQPVRDAVRLRGIRHLDPAQRRVVAALAGEARLLVIEGAAGTGKTTTLAAARDAIAASGPRLVVVTPTLKAAQAEWLALDYTNTLEDGTGANEGYTSEEIGAVVNTTTDALIALLAEGHGTNMSRLL